jgi:hypothetical protein
MNPRDLSWDIEDPKDMTIVIRYQGKQVMALSMYEAIEGCSRKAVLDFIKECDNTPWLTRWNSEKYAELTDILKR